MAHEEPARLVSRALEQASEQGTEAISERTTNASSVGWFTSNTKDLTSPCTAVGSEHAAASADITHAGSEGRWYNKDTAFVCADIGSDKKPRPEKKSPSKAGRMPCNSLAASSAHAPAPPLAAAATVVGLVTAPPFAPTPVPIATLPLNLPPVLPPSITVAEVVAGGLGARFATSTNA